MTIDSRISIAFWVQPSHSFNTCSTTGWLILLSRAFKTSRTDSRVLFFFLTISEVKVAAQELTTHVKSKEFLECSCTAWHHNQHRESLSSVRVQFDSLLCSGSFTESTESPSQTGEDDWKEANPKNVQVVFHAGELRMTGE
jgi:hypothetical protein